MKLLTAATVLLVPLFAPSCAATRVRGNHHNGGMGVRRMDDEERMGGSGGKSMKMKSKKSMKSMSMMSSSSTRTLYGDALPLGDGYVRTFAVLEEEETTTLGIKFNLDSLSNLPTTPSDGLYDIRDADGNTVIPLSGHTYEMFFPDEAVSNVLPFRHVGVNWNPDGHPPPDVYMIPHFDFHFYTVSSERRNTCVTPPLITEACPLTGPNNPPFANVDCAGLEYLTVPLPADQTPANYILVDGPAEAAMGNHMIPVASSEFQPDGSFTHTWIYGVEGGNINFYEPMITHDYLLWLVEQLDNYSSSSDDEVPVDPNGGTISVSDNTIIVKVPFPSVPDAYPEAGMYPTAYHMSYESSAETFSIELTDYEFFPGSSLVQNLPCPSVSSAKTVYGDAVPIGDGYMRTFAVIEDDETSVLGIKFDLDTLNNLPTTPSDGQYDIRDAEGNTVIPLSGHTYELFFPDEAVSNVLPFRHVGVNWNPDGHPPPDVYMIPHFDFHFYTVTSERRNTCVTPPLITEVCPLNGPMDPPFANVDCAGLEYLTVPLPADQTPANYILVDGPAEAAMGNHMIPVASSEFQPDGSFTHTWIYGVEGGNINFYEPMITHDYLLWLVDQLVTYTPGDEAPVDPNGGTIVISDSKIAVKVSFPSIPQAYPEAGMYPTAYHMTFDGSDHTFTIELTDYQDFPMSSLVQNLPCPNSM